jgi:hypothetical protein
MAGDDGGGHILKMAGVRENDRKKIGTGDT